MFTNFIKSELNIAEFWSLGHFDYEISWIFELSKVTIEFFEIWNELSPGPLEDLIAILKDD